MSTETNSTPELIALRNQVYILLIALIIVSGTLTVYLYRQASITRKDIEAIQPQAQQVIGAFNQNQKLMMDFVNALGNFGKTHPDFVPVLTKNGIGPAATPAASAPAAGAAPAAPAAPKK